MVITHYVIVTPEAGWVVVCVVRLSCLMSGAKLMRHRIRSLGRVPV